MKKGFTLAEVLITLGIIGIVAALTIPTLIAKHQKQVFATQLKKSYSSIGQALQMAQLEYGDMSGWENLAEDINQNKGEDDSYSKEKISEFVKTHLI